MIFSFFAQIAAQMCEYETRFSEVARIQSIEKQEISGYVSNKVKFYANCILKNNKNPKRLEICTSCHDRISFDNKFFALANKCNLISLDRDYQIFTTKDQDKNCILVIECKDNYFIPVYFNENFYVFDLKKFDQIDSKIIFKFDSNLKPIPYAKIKGIIAYHLYKAENCTITMPLDRYIEREYSKNLVLNYSNAFNNLYFADTSLFKTKIEEASSSEEGNLFNQKTDGSISDLHSTINDIRNSIY